MYITIYHYGVLIIIIYNTMVSCSLIYMFLSVYYLVFLFIVLLYCTASKLYIIILLYSLSLTYVPILSSRYIYKHYYYSSLSYPSRVTLHQFNLYRTYLSLHIYTRVTNIYFTCLYLVNTLLHGLKSLH